MKNLQKTYESKIGSAVLSINTAIVGTPTTFRLTYTVGELGIDESGEIKVLFRTAGDCADPQLTDSKKPNFLKITSSNTDVVFLVDSKSTGLKGKVHERPWSRGVRVTVTNQYLSQGDKVYFDFVQWRTQTFAEDKHIFKVVVDPFATGRCLELPKQPFLYLKADKINKLVVLAPSQATIGKTISLLIKAEDQWGNPAENFSGTVKLAMDFPKTVRLKNGRALVPVQQKTEGILRIQATCRDFVGQSNPIIVQQNTSTKNKIFWADLHGQSSETIGTNDVNSYFRFAKDYSHLDVTCIQGNDFQITNAFWKKINKTTKKINKPHSFISFPGYEWSGNTNRGGDRNIIYLHENEKIYRSSHALLDEFSDSDSDATIVTDLFPKLDHTKTIVIPHVGGRYADLQLHNEKLEPVVEIHSAWGTFEWFYFDALKRNYKVGVVANSDDHSGRLGASYPAFAHFNSYGGLTGIVAKNLDRKTIFEAIKSRHCYATTGTHMCIDYFVSNFEGQTVMMGDHISSKQKPIEISVKCYATASIERVEIYALDQLKHTQYVEPESNSNFLKILCSGSRVKGRARAFDWKGELRFDSTQIKALEKINFYSKRNVITNTKNQICWSGITTGGVQGFIAQLTEMKGSATLKLNQKNIVIPLEKLAMKPKRIKMGGLDSEASYYKTVAATSVFDIQFSTMINLKPSKHRSIPIFVKVIQRDGHMAWTSPVFVS
ncbi:MAG: DUF3604 domain-containing protein [Patescibacteria group bacterium]|nr:MAG: DUF3604 domain-containing protein [Patescibacteria group bacterium]